MIGKSCRKLSFQEQGEGQHTTNYQSVAILPAIGKVLDRIQSQQQLAILQRTVFSPTNSSVFSIQFATCHFVKLFDRWRKALDKGKETSRRCFLTSIKRSVERGTTACP